MLINRNIEIEIIPTTGELVLVLSVTAYLFLNLSAAVILNRRWQAKRLMAVHSSKFVLALHALDEPLKEISRLNEKIGLPLVTPKIGEPANLNDTTQTFTEWWKDIRETVK